MHLALSARKTDLLCAIMADLTHSYDSREVRTRVGTRLLDLFEADFFASFVWNPEKKVFEDRVTINMDPGNLDNYEKYFQFHDPITSKLQQRKRATAVNEIMDQPDLMRTEFFNDFLAHDGLYYGMNYYAYDGSRNIGDFRIWRGRGRDNFTRRDLQLLDAIGPAFTNAQKNILAVNMAAREREKPEPGLDAVVARFKLTPRERIVAQAILSGKSDKAIAEAESVAFSTVRTHVQNLFQKLHVGSRTELVHRLMNAAKSDH